MIVGASGSGKTTLARRVAAVLDLPFHPTDHLYWRPGWRPADRAAIDGWADDLLARPRWVIDGNFDAQHDRLWRGADRIVWLDLPRSTTFVAVVIRNLSWWARRRPVWGGDRMTLARLIGGVRHSLAGVSAKRACYPERLASLPPGVVTVLRSRRQVRAWLAGTAAARS